MASISTIELVRVEAATYSHSDESNTEIDNHADTMVSGSNCLPFHYFDILVDVSGWYASAGSF